SPAVDRPAVGLAAVVYRGGSLGRIRGDCTQTGAPAVGDLPRRPRARRGQAVQPCVDRASGGGGASNRRSINQRDGGPDRKTNGRSARAARRRVSRASNAAFAGETAGGAYAPERTGREDAERAGSRGAGNRSAGGGAVGELPARFSPLSPPPAPL